MTPIEKMVDEACGVTKGFRKRTQEIDEASKRMVSVADAARAWWESKRPEGWDEEDHCERPAVNCVTEADRNLAVAVGLLVELGW